MTENGRTIPSGNDKENTCHTTAFPSPNVNRVALTERPNIDNEDNFTNADEEELAEMWRDSQRDNTRNDNGSMEREAQMDEQPESPASWVSATTIINDANEGRESVRSMATESREFTPISQCEWACGGCMKCQGYPTECEWQCGECQDCIRFNDIENMHRGMLYVEDIGWHMPPIIDSSHRLQRELGLTHRVQHRTRAPVWPIRDFYHNLRADMRIDAHDREMREEIKAMETIFGGTVF